MPTPRAYFWRNTFPLFIQFTLGVGPVSWPIADICLSLVDPNTSDTELCEMTAEKNIYKQRK